ncbi:CRISPR-associated protein Cas4 [Anaerolineales bacterium HSG6]|nr:CRISPR-associated protein Cas4 [Anaerolineales bacterium HSG6]
MFIVTELKQYNYCPRLIYYHHCLPDVRPITAKMKLGQAAQTEEEARAARRSLRRYGLADGNYETNQYLASEQLGLRGRVDLVIKTNDNSAGELELIPVDYKDSTRQVGNHFKLQLLAYALLLTEQTGLPAKRGFIYSIPKRRATEIKFSARMKKTLQRSLEIMQTIVLHESLPEPTKQRRKCEVCEFRRFCNDV